MFYFREMDRWQVCLGLEEVACRSDWVGWARIAQWVGRTFYDLQRICLLEVKDVGRWEIYVSDLRAIIDSKLMVSINNPTVCTHLVSAKCICVTWRACLGHIPLAMALAQRGVHLNSTYCSMFANGVEDADHMLLGYPLASEALEWIFNWCGILFHKFSPVSNFVSFATYRVVPITEDLHCHLLWIPMVCVEG